MRFRIINSQPDAPHWNRWVAVVGRRLVAAIWVSVGRPVWWLPRFDFIKDKHEGWRRVQIGGGWLLVCVEIGVKWRFLAERAAGASGGNGGNGIREKDGL